MSKRRLQTNGEDVFDLPEDHRESLQEDRLARSFGAVGIDDYCATDKVLRGNGQDYFVSLCDDEGCDHHGTTHVCI